MLWLIGNSSADFDDYCAVRGVSYRRFTTVKEKADGDLVVYLDMRSERSMIASFQRLQPQPDITALFVAGYEHYVLPAAWLAAHLQMPGCRVKAAQAATDKALMRQAFIAADPALSPAYAHISSWEDVESFTATHEFPVMLKPANLMKSLFITKNQSVDELRANYEYMLAELPATYQKYRLGEPRIIIEECLIGSMHTVAGFVDDQGTPHLIEQIVDCVTAQDIGVADNYLFSRRLPSRLSASHQAQILDVAKRAVIALGLTSTPVHVELMFTSDGPKIIEIGARLGGYRPRMYSLAAGIDLYGAALQIAAGQPPDTEPQSTRSVSVIELFPTRDGSFAGSDDEQNLRQLASFEEIHWKAQTGDTIGLAAHGYRATAILTLVHDDPQQLLADESFIRENYQIAVQP